MTPRFHEEQAMRQWWLLLLIGGVAALQWWGFYQQIVLGIPWGSNPGPDWLVILFWLLVGIGLPLLFWYGRLIVTVDEEAVLIHFRPVTRRTIPYTEIISAEARAYSPMREYGGWGLRGWGKRRAYNVSGNRGVELVLTDGSRIMIGSQRADDLAQAIHRARA